jgi:hypothetical protein
MVILPFENTKKYPNINQDSDETKFLNSNGLLINSSIYDIDGFEKTYGIDFFDNINPGQNVNCLFRYFIYISYHSTNINYVDINLQLQYINI